MDHSRLSSPDSLSTISVGPLAMDSPPVIEILISPSATSSLDADSQANRSQAPQQPPGFVTPPPPSMSPYSQYFPTSAPATDDHPYRPFISFSESGGSVSELDLGEPVQEEQDRAMPSHVVVLSGADRLILGREDARVEGSLHAERRRLMVEDMELWVGGFEEGEGEGERPKGGRERERRLKRLRTGGMSRAARKAAWKRRRGAGRARGPDGRFI